MRFLILQRRATRNNCQRIGPFQPQLQALNGFSSKPNIRVFDGLHVQRYQAIDGSSFTRPYGAGDHLSVASCREKMSKVRRDIAIKKISSKIVLDQSRFQRYLEFIYVFPIIHSIQISSASITATYPASSAGSFPYSQFSLLPNAHLRPFFSPSHPSVNHLLLTIGATSSTSSTFP